VETGHVRAGRRYFANPHSNSAIALEIKHQRTSKLMFATIYLPNFYLQAATRYQPDLCAHPAALIEEQEKKPVIIQLNEAAERAGIHKGRTPSQALARFLQVVIKARSQPQEQSMQQTLLHYSFTLSPFVEETAPGIATIQFTDNRNLFEKVSRVIAQLKDCEIIAQAGIADKPDTSFLAAHLAQPVLKVDDARDFLAPLPIGTLEIAIN
jgi:protein ImuB